MDTIEAIHGRRSIRAFRDEPVPRSLIEDLLWDAAQAPTPPVSSETPWAFCVIEGKQRLARYGERAKRQREPTPGQPLGLGSAQRLQGLLGCPDRC